MVLYKPLIRAYSIGLVFLDTEDLLAKFKIHLKNELLNRKLIKPNGIYFGGAYLYIENQKEDFTYLEDESDWFVRDFPTLNLLPESILVTKHGVFIKVLEPWKISLCGEDLTQYKELIRNIWTQWL
jgi:hypothetical protein